MTSGRGPLSTGAGLSWLFVWLFGSEPLSSMFESQTGSQQRQMPSRFERLPAEFALLKG